MKLHWPEKWLMNTSPRAWIQRRYEAPWMFAGDACVDTVFAWCQTVKPPSPQREVEGAWLFPVGTSLGLSPPSTRISTEDRSEDIPALSTRETAAVPRSGADRRCPSLIAQDDGQVDQVDRCDLSPSLMYNGG